MWYIHKNTSEMRLKLENEERKGFGMIEIIQDENETKEIGLPKEIRQIGNAEIGDRIYLEEKVHQYLHRKTGWSEPVIGEERRVFTLLGKIENYAGQKCIFIEYAIRIQDIAFLEGIPVWNEKIWEDIFQKMKKHSEEMIIVGWAMDIKDTAPTIMERLGSVHTTHFGGKHQILFLLDSLEKEENFYCCRQGKLRKREGFYLYRDKRTLASIKEKVPKATVTLEKVEEDKDFEKLFWEQDEAEEEQIRTYIANEKEPEEEPREKGQFRTFMHESEKKEKQFHFSPTYLLAAIALVLVVAVYQNNEQMKEMKETIAQINVSQAMFGEKDAEKKESEAEEVRSEEEMAQTEIPSEENAVEIEQLQGELEKNTEASENEATETTTQPAQTEAATQPAQTEVTTQPSQAETSAQPAPAETALTEGQIYMNQGYYVVQKGDNLESICQKIYQTTAMMEKMCEVNGIKNSDEIYEGQCLTLPK